MPPELPKTDFRRVRRYLADEDFALNEGPAFVPLGRISKDVWEEITGLPTDVAIRTTDYKPNAVSGARRIAASWLGAYEPLDDSPFHWQSMAVYENSNSSLFNAVSGWYRVAGTSLRVAVDDLLLGLYFQSQPDKLDEFRQIVHEAGRSPQFREMRTFLFERTGDSMFENAGAYASLYYDCLSKYVHRIADGLLWGSNGPIFENEAFEQWWAEYQRTDDVLRCAFEIVRGPLDGQH
ncbi:MAG: hypothetical protein WB681_08495 [Candidatus Cybelea sp.]